MSFQTNPQLDIAFEYVRYTDKNIFLTGKAGTGKTTFLHKIKNDAIKRMVIVAPTGVAAINAGGVTIHSFFQLPFGPFLPGAPQDPSRQRKFSGEKIKIIKSLDLLVIDEISMVRADLLDGIDDVLRRYKDFSKPFGGVQLLMIGDLHQLPPVIKEDEWNMLRAHYETPYFFGSKALSKTQPVAIELKHIYRQSDAVFINLLNKVRDNKIDNEVLTLLNSRYQPNFQVTEQEPYITLTSHNATAQQINNEKLEAISSPSLTFKAKIEGDFPEYAYPTEETLKFKSEAQIMFVKNDISRDKLYYNGKIGKIMKIEKEVIHVRCPDDYTDILVSPVEWQNIKYSLDEQTKEIKEEVVGSFLQYPLKLAWAITIHKSQGLTFERAIIDANAAFAHGQVYVALSRCKTFEGIVLRSKIGAPSIKTDSVVRNYSEDIDKNAPNEAQLKVSKIDFQQSLIVELFNFSPLKRLFEKGNRAFLENETIINEEAVRSFQDLWTQAEKKLFSIAEKFKPQLEIYFSQADLPEQHEALQERIQKAAHYFVEQLQHELMPAFKILSVVTDNKSVMKQLGESLEAIEKAFFIKKSCFEQAKNGFLTHQYLRIKANADMDFISAKRASLSVGNKDEAASPRDSEHPALYTLLKKWRDNTAADAEMEPYMVLPSKVLLDLSNELPLTSTDLKKMKGIGVVKVKQFGSFIIQIIEEYCKQNGIDTSNVDLTFKDLEQKKTPKPDTKILTFELYRQGKSIVEIAAERNLAASTIEGHLAHFVGTGDLDLYDLLESSKIDAIEQYLTTHQVTGSSEVFTHFGGQYSYGEIRLVMQYLKKQN